jgi:hypothetical protein
MTDRAGNFSLHRRLGFSSDPVARIDRHAKKHRKASGH